MFRVKSALVAGALAVLALSACSSSGGSTSTNVPAATSAGAGAQGTAPGGAAIKVGFMCSCSGVQASLLAGVSKVAQAWANSTNASGGVNGHPVQLFTEDDSSNPATALQEAKKLVEQDHVVAIVGEVSLVDQTWVPWVVSQGIPVVGGASGEPVQGSTPGVFPSGSTLLPVTIGILDGAKGMKNLGVMVCAESPVCAQIIPVAQGAGKLLGLSVTPATISATAPNYTAPCLQMKSAGVTAVFVGDNGPIVQRVAADCAQQGYNPLQVVGAAGTTSSELSDPHLAGAVAAGPNANPFDASTPAVKEFQDALAKYYPGLLTSAGFTYDDFYAWAGGKLFEAAAKAGNIGPSSTPADLMNGLYALKNETLGGLSAPLTYTKGKPYATTCWFTSKVENGALVSLNGNRPVCLTAAQAAGLSKLG